MCAPHSTKVGTAVVSTEIAVAKFGADGSWRIPTFPSRISYDSGCAWRFTPKQNLVASVRFFRRGSLAKLPKDVMDQLFLLNGFNKLIAPALVFAAAVRAFPCKAKCESRLHRSLSTN
jgi:hypothetical protein